MLIYGKLFSRKIYFYRRKQMILSCNHISKSYGVETILDDCSFFINDNEKAAIEGNNGAASQP